MKIIKLLIRLKYRIYQEIVNNLFERDLYREILLLIDEENILSYEIFNFN